MERHGRSHFYKYLKADSAIAVLENQTFRFSTSSLFNDPFDIPINHLKMGITKDEFAKAYIDRILETIDGKKPLPLFLEQSRSKYGLLLNVLPKLKISKEEREKLYRNVSQISDKEFEEKRELVIDQIKPFFSSLYLFCVSECNDSILMWSHYADNHSGIVFRLNCIEEIDNPLCIATPIKYKKELPSFGTAEEWINLLAGERGINGERLYMDVISTKAIDWQYEKEWRVIQDIPSCIMEHIDLPFNPRELGAVYLGVKISPNNKEKIIRLVKEKFPSVEIFQANKSAQKFSLEFRNLSVD